MILMFGIGFQELLVILLFALILFGPRKLPELARFLGKGLAEFRKASNDFRNALEIESLKDSSPPRPTQNTENQSSLKRLPSECYPVSAASESDDPEASVKTDEPETPPFDFPSATSDSSDSKPSTSH